MIDLDSVAGDAAVVPRNGLGTAGLVLGVLSVLLLLVPVLGVLLAVIGLVLAVLGRRRAVRHEATNGGVAVTAMVISAAGLLIGVLVTALFASVVASGLGVVDRCDDGREDSARDACVRDGIQDLLGG